MNSQQEQQQTGQQKPDLVSLWEQMGATTGSLIGRFIGLNAQMGLEALQSLTAATGMEPGIRSKVWTEMGRAYGESLGYSIGLTMDGFANSVDKTVVQPLAETQRE